MQTGLSSNDDTAPLDLREIKLIPINPWNVPVNIRFLTESLRAVSNQLETLACFIYPTMRELFDSERHNFVLTTVSRMHDIRLERTC